MLWLRPGGLVLTISTLVLLALAPLPSMVRCRRQANLLAVQRDQATDQAERARHLFETIRFKAQRLTEELSEADQQARMAHQLTLLGQFVAGFLHEVNNPLGILTGRVEVLLEERQGDESLRRDLEEILKEARYIAKIAETLLPALRQAKVDNTFEPSSPGKAIGEAVTALSDRAAAQGASLLFEPADAPRANLPAHVLQEVIRALVTNALQSLGGSGGGKVWIRMKSGHPSRSTVLFEVEDDGPGVPADLQPHLFEPFVSSSNHSQRSGLGLFIVASLLQIYEGSVRYEKGDAGGARFVVEVPRARFTKEQPYHWFVSGLSGEKGKEP